MQILMLVIAICFFIIMLVGVFIFLLKNEVKEEKSSKKYRERMSNQMHYEKTIPLPIAKYDNDKKARVTIMMFLLVVASLLFLSVYITNTSLSYLTFYLLGGALVLCFVIAFVDIRKEVSANDFIQYFKEKINEKYCVISDYSGNAKEYVVNYYKDIIPFFKGYSPIIQTTELTVNVDEWKINLGFDKILLYIGIAGDSSKSKVNSIRAEITLPYYFEHKMLLSNEEVIYRDEENSIIPNYTCIPLIKFEKEAKEYAQKMFNDAMQERIAKIASKAKRFFMELNENKVIISVCFTHGGYPLSKKNQLYDDIILSLEEMANYLVDFTEEIEI